MLATDHSTTAARAGNSTDAGGFSQTTLKSIGKVVPSYPAAAPQPSDAQTNDASNVTDIEKARMAQEQMWLDEHGVDQRTSKPKAPSIESIYAGHMTRKNSDWACQATEATGAIIHKWSGVYWKAVNNEMGVVCASSWLEKRARHAASERKSESCWRYASVRLRQHNPLPQFDPKRAIVPCSDAYIEILPHSFKALAPDPALGMTHAAKIKCGARHGSVYVPRPLPAMSKFARFLARALPDADVRALVQEQCGMTLLPGNYSQAAWWFGTAGSGKSTLAEIVEALHRQSVRLNLDTLGDRFSLEPLIGASLILVDEVESEKWAEGRFKSLVSGNGLPIDRKNEKALASYHSRAKWLITSNSPPFVRDKSDGVWRRLAVVNWGVTIPEAERIPDFQKIVLEEEGQLILDWILEGARRIVARGRALVESDASYPDAALRAKQQARNNSDSVRAWSTELRVVSSPGRFMPTTDLYESYSQWCLENGYTERETLTNKQFWRGMSEAGLYKPDLKVNRRIHGKQTDLYELEILGTHADLACAWATAHHVAINTEETMTSDEIYGQYKRWVSMMIAERGFHPRNLLDAREWMATLTKAGFIDDHIRICRDGLTCYRIRIADRHQMAKGTGVTSQKISRKAWQGNFNDQYSHGKSPDPPPAVSS